MVFRLLYTMVITLETNEFSMYKPIERVQESLAINLIVKAEILMVTKVLVA